MTDLNDMTSDELRAYADQKEKEDSFRVIKTGKAKHNLYYLDKDEINSILYKFEYVITKNEANELLRQIRGEIKLTVSKGETLECMNPSGYDDLWYDLGPGNIDGFHTEWAEEHLKNIKDVEE